MWVDRIAFFMAIPHPYLYKASGTTQMPQAFHG